jgi:hypothetical protein
VEHLFKNDVISALVIIHDKDVNIVKLEMSKIIFRKNLDLTVYEKPEEQYKVGWASSLFEWAKIWIDSSQLCIFVYSQDKRILLYNMVYSITRYKYFHQREIKQLTIQHYFQSI